ncbi:MAG: FkbM family methyltransferase [bacterium]|nr:FkbM family methyltransferase [bacterium]
MTLGEKKRYYLQLFDKASAVAQDWEKRYGGSGFLCRIYRMIHMPRLLTYLLSRLGRASQDVRTETFWGYPMLLPGPGSDAFRLSTFGTLGYKNEDKLVRFLITSIQPSDVFYDIGASYGFYTYLASEFITEGEIHAFEPLPRAFHFLRYNTRGNARCILNNCVLSDRDGLATFYQGYPSTVSSTMLEKVAETNVWNAYQKTEVASTTLDSYVEHHRKPTLLKIDTEGAEELIIKGGRNFFSKNNPTVVMEVLGGEKGEKFSLPAIQELLELGYKAHTIAEDGSLEEKSREDIVSSRTDTFDNLVFCR